MEKPPDVGRLYEYRRGTSGTLYKYQRKPKQSKIINKITRAIKIAYKVYELSET